MKTVLERYNALKFQEKQLKKELNLLKEALLAEYGVGDHFVEGYQITRKEVVSRVIDSKLVRDVLKDDVSFVEKERVTTRLSVVKVPESGESGLELVREA